MSEKAKLQLDGKSYELSVITGTENEKAIDIHALRDETGFITLDDGYANTGACSAFGFAPEEDENGGYLIIRRDGGPASAPGSVSSSTAADAPRARQERNCSCAAAGPSVTTVTDPPNRSTSRTASSTAHSSCGLIVKPDALVSIARRSAVSVIAPPTVGTRLTQTKISITAAHRIRSPAGSNTAACAATVTG